MKASQVARIVLTNAVIIGLISLVLEDDSGRLAYFRSLGFTTSTAYYPFFYITSAVNGSTYIAGQLTLDWVQVLAVALLVLDLGFVLPYLRRRGQPGPEPEKLTGPV
jgi:hypothetical protein